MLKDARGLIIVIEPYQLFKTYVIQPMDKNQFKNNLLFLFLIFFFCKIKYDNIKEHLIDIHGTNFANAIMQLLNVFNFFFH